MKIVRGPRPDRFTVVDNRVIRDHRLSFRARGILINLLSQPDGWETDSTRLAEHATGKKGDKREGRDAVRAALRELEELGYVAYERTQAPGRRGGKVWRTSMVVRDVPASGFPAYRWDGSSDPKTENPSRRLKIRPRVAGSTPTRRLKIRPRVDLRIRRRVTSRPFHPKTDSPASAWPSLLRRTTTNN